MTWFELALMIARQHSVWEKYIRIGPLTFKMDILWPNSWSSIDALERHVHFEDVYTNVAWVETIIISQYI